MKNQKPVFIPIRSHSERAFSSPSRRYSTLDSPGSPVDHTTSWLTVNPHKGCSVGCAYCFREEWHPDSVPRLTIAPDVAVQALVSHPEFVPHLTPLSANISSTDSMLPAVKESTFAVIEKLDAMGYRNPFGITTKLPITKHDIERIRRLSTINVIFFVSLAFIPKRIEPIATSHRIANLRLLAKERMPTVLYARPLVRGWNTSTHTLERLLELGEAYCSAVCVGGLRLTERIGKRIALVDSSADETDNSHAHDIRDKVLDPDVWDALLTIHQERAFRVPLYKHTSCAVSLLRSRPNYNRLFDFPEQHCSPTCPAGQQRRCKHDG